jgi:hypothetical protein
MKKKYPKWSPERRRKFMATVRAKHKHGKKMFRKGGAMLLPLGATTPSKGNDVKDAIVFLRHARTWIMARMQDGTLKAPDQAHLYTLLALAVLSGEAA